MVSQLFVGRERSISALNEAMNREKEIFLAAQKNAKTNEPSPEDIFTVGRGPYAVVASKGRKKLFITNFLEDTIAVVDVTPGASTRNRVVLRIGEPKPP